MHHDINSFAIAVILFALVGPIGAARAETGDARDTGVSCDRGNHQADFLPRHRRTITTGRYLG